MQVNGKMFETIAMATSSVITEMNTLVLEMIVVVAIAVAILLKCLYTSIVASALPAPTSTLVELVLPALEVALKWWEARTAMPTFALRLPLPHHSPNHRWVEHSSSHNPLMGHEGRGGTSEAIPLMGPRPGGS